MQHKITHFFDGEKTCFMINGKKYSTEDFKPFISENNIFTFKHVSEELYIKKAYVPLDNDSEEIVYYYESEDEVIETLKKDNDYLKTELQKNEKFLLETDKKLTEALQQLDELVNDYKIFVSSLIDNKNMLEDKLNWLQEVDEKRFDIKFN